MQTMVEDCLKPRLTERVDILTAINILRSRGYEQDALISEITRLFYVDLDEFNSVIGWLEHGSERREAAFL
ncbi:hypothetical protein [Pseudaminobacter salicylatoxidans]|uniref:hypothetical protein n=1 Tax=Pseudaminobacter salicylatoxidans TaxID=93369 RepID=UPI0002DBC8B4|nr:hypothetical protein [Pseudaminobacter salicylatoxidans]